MLIDSHVHIFNEYYNDIKNVIKNSKKSGIKKIINCSVNIETAKEIINLEKDNKGYLYSAIGIHPHYVKKYTYNDILALKKMLENEKVIAIGEIGLDYHYNKNKKKQKKLFKIQLTLAKKYKLPVIIHSRDSIIDVYKILKKYKLKGIIHCFSGNREEAIKFINIGFILGVGGIITFKKNSLKEVIKDIDLEYIVIETDSPYLTPEPYRKNINEPKYINEIVKKISVLKRTDINKVINNTYNNLCRIFDFS